MSNLEKNKNYDVCKMIRCFAEDESLRQFLEKYKIAKISEINFKKYFNKEVNRCTAIIDAQEEFFNHRTKILIDLRLGQPSVNQVFDSLYEIGKDCDVKIILFTHGYNDYDEGIPVADEYVVTNLAGELQSNNVPVACFQIDRDSLKEKYVESYQNWFAVNRLKSCRIPTKERFMASTFWGVYFDSYNLAFYEPWNNYKSLFSESKCNNYIIYIDSIFYGENRLKWDDKGARYEIKQISESDEYLKKVLDVKMPALKRQYGENAVRFENVVGKLPRLYINYSDKPFDWLYTADPDQITEYAKKMYHDAWNLRWLIEGTIKELYQVDHA